MATKRKRESDDDSFSSPISKQIKEEEVTRSGRVRKKPSKFKEDEKGDDTKNKSQVESVSMPVYAVKEEPEPEEIVTPARSEMSLSADEEFGKSGGGRAGRARKKSAKVLEMEEFEEAERKSMKKDLAKKGVVGSPGPNLQKKTPKSPTSPVLLMTSPQATSKIKVTSTPVYTTPISTQISPPKKNVSPKSPVSLSSQVVPGEGKASVIKLLLSSPSQSASSIISSTAVSQISTITDKSQTATTKKKGKAKDKPKLVGVTSPTVAKSQVKQMLQMPSQSVVVKTEPVSRIVEETEPVSQIVVKTEPVSQEVITENSTQNAEKPVTPAKIEKVKASKEPKVKKEKKSPKVEVISSSSLPSPNVIHVGSMSLASGSQSRTDLDNTSAKKRKLSKVKGEEAMISDEYELDVPEIELGEPGEDTFMKMDEDSLDIPSEEFDMKSKSSKRKKLEKKTDQKNDVEDNDLPEIPSSDLVMDFSRMKSTERGERKKKKTVKELVEVMDKSKKKRAPTAYTLWCNINRPKVVEDNPGIDFSTISKTLGEMWSSLPEKEKLVWKRRAKKATGKGSTLITTGKASAAKPLPPQIIPVSKPTRDPIQKMAVVQAAPVSIKQHRVPIDDMNVPLKGFGKEPMDVAAHLKIVGESLSIIGMKLQEHRGLIAVQGSLSVLLDSMLCAVAPLMCLTSILPETDGLSEQVHMKNLDNIAYIMPGL